MANQRDEMPAASCRLAPAIVLAVDCLPVTGNRILGRDLALADARFSSLPASLTSGVQSGARRKTNLLPTLELQRLAHG